jgi:3-hydroxyisobutyrate dehydrogenase-like beta-hydroxyacid dehydrogenase
MNPVGFIGCGTMGAPMVRQLLAKGHAVVVHDVADGAIAPLVAAGAMAAESAAALSARCRIVLTSLPAPPDVEAVAHELIAAAEPGTVHVDLTTGSWDVARRVAALEAEHGIRYLDAPVSGGRFAAESGTLTIMASGDPAAWETARPVLQAIGEKLFHLGPEVGSGTLVKLVNNAIFLASGLVGQECLTLAAKAGLSVPKVLEVLKASSAAVYLGLTELTLGRNFDDAFFTLRLARKDLTLALESAAALGVPMEVTAAAERTYARAEVAGLGGQVFFATLRAIEKAAGLAPER